MAILDKKTFFFSKYEIMWVLIKDLNKKLKKLVKLKNLLDTTRYNVDTLMHAKDGKTVIHSFCFYKTYITKLFSLT